MIITITTTIAPVVTMSIPSTPCDSRRRAERKAARSAWRATPAALMLHLAEHLPAVWTVCALPKPLRRRAYGARLALGDCHLYVAATRRRVDVLALRGDAVVFSQVDFLPADLLPTIRDAARAVFALHPCDAPEWAKVTT